MKAYINGEEQEITHKGGYLYIERIWENADKVTLDFKIETKVVKLNNSQAIVRGPLLFARDSRFNDGDIDECATIKCNNQGVIQAKIKKNKTGTFPWITLTVPAVLGTDLENVENKTPKLFATFLLLAMIGIPMGVTGYGYHKHSMPCPNLIKSTKYDSLA